MNKIEELMWCLYLGTILGATICLADEAYGFTPDNLPSGVITLSQGARLENLEMENITIIAQDDNYSMKNVKARNWIMYVNGTRIR